MTAASQHAHTVSTHAFIILEQTYPAWRIRQSRAGMWSARRTVTLNQAEAGLHRFIVQPTLEALSAILAQQLEIAQRIRG